MTHIHTRVARADELPHVAAAYIAWGYGGGIRPEDVAFVAERDGVLTGIVRRSWEFDTLMLRGMWIDPDARGLGVGSRLLRTFVDALDADPSTRGHACYGVPYAHLERFYAQGGFAFMPVSTAPVFLQERIARYAADGREAAFMQRPGTPADAEGRGR